MKKRGKYALMMVAQLLLILFAGIFAKDSTAVILISSVGVVFNFLVSVNEPVGFLFGFVYAISSGILAFKTGVYATFAFLLFLQAPMAIYSFIGWGKQKKDSDAIMKKMPYKGVALLCGGMVLLGVVMYFVLKMLHSQSVLLDAIFFVCSVSACLLLAIRYKNAYIITLLSGLGGTALWGHQTIQTGVGISLAVFYFIVCINSVLAVYHQYLKKETVPTVTSA